MVTTRTKGNQNENKVKEILEKKGFLVEKTRHKHWRAAGNTDFFGLFDLWGIPKKDSLFNKQVLVQVKSRKQYGKEKLGVEEFVRKETKSESYEAYFVWHEGRGRGKVWKFEYIDKTGEGKNIICSEEDWRGFE